MTPRPSIIPVNPVDIDDALKGRDQWVCWRLVYQAEKDHWTKRPYQVNGRPASSTNPSTWVSFADALREYKLVRCTGIGFVLSPDDPFFCVDLDKVRDPETGRLNDLAWRWLQLDTYVDVSPSGTGLHLWLSGNLPADVNRHGAGRRSGPIEIYPSGRFMTVTGVLPEAQA